MDTNSAGLDDPGRPARILTSGAGIVYAVPRGDVDDLAQGLKYLAE